MKLISTLLSLAATAYATVDILLPLYVWPSGDENVAQWQATLDAIDANPSLNYYVIINPSNGAPYATPQQEADIKKDWSKWIGAMNARSNVKTLGYIYTGFATPRDINVVKAGIDAYAAWTTAQWWDNVDYDISIKGIFFDEVAAQPSLVSHFDELMDYTRLKITNGIAILNPGVPVQAGAESLYDKADAILTLETCYTADPSAPNTHCPKVPGTSTPAYTPFRLSPQNSLDILPTNAVYRAKSSVVVHDFYETYEPYQPVSLPTLTDAIQAIIARGVHSFYITESNYNQRFNVEPASVGTVSSIASEAQNLLRKRRMRA